jgi:hypothetical protein
MMRLPNSGSSSNDGRTEYAALGAVRLTFRLPQSASELPSVAERKFANGNFAHEPTLLCTAQRSATESGCSQFTLRPRASRAFRA